MERYSGTSVNSSVRTEALQLAALCASLHGNGERARALTEESFSLVGDLTDSREIAYRLRGAGFLLNELGDHGRAGDLLTEARSQFAELGDKAGLGLVLRDLGLVAREEGDAERMRELCRESVQLSREAGNMQYVAFALEDLGVATRMLGDLDQARVLCEQALHVYGQTGMVLDRAEMLASLAAILRDQSDIDGAKTLLIEGLQLCRTGSRDSVMTAMNLEGMAGLAAAQDRAECASILLAAASRLRERIGHPTWPVNRPGIERDLASSRETLGVERFTEMWERGCTMTVDRAISFALGEPPGP